MKVGDTVKLIASPALGWMKKYLEETFEVLAFPTKSGVEVQMVGTEPAWKWIVGKNNFEVATSTPLEPSFGWFMYVVKCSDDSLYTGITTDVKRRLYEHNNTAKGAKYTKTRRPVTLLYSQEHPDRSKASRDEAKFKKLSREQKLETISEVR